MGKGSSTSSTTSTSSADPAAAALYRDILARAQGVASTPYQAYTGQLTADVNAQQNLGISGINANANFASPYIQQASGLAGASSAPITAQTIQQYQNPYTQQVVDATMAQMQHDNQVADAQLRGNQIAQGALGGNATGVARGILAGQQARTQASTTADLYNRSYQQALSAAQQQQQTGLAGANAIANYGISGQNAALAGANAQIGAGTLQQQTEQQRLNALYQQYQLQQAYPYQQTQWLAGIGTGVGSNLGGTSTGTTTGPAPNSTGQWLGAGLSAASLFLSDARAKEDIEHIGTTNDGQNIYRYRYKGQPGYHIGLIAQEVEQDHPESVPRGLDGARYVDIKGATDDAVERAAGGGVGGMPFEGVQGWIPQMQIHAGSGAPRASAPGLPSQGGGFDPSQMAKGITDLGGKLKGLDWGGAWDAGLGNLSGDAWGGGSFWKGDAYGGSSASPLMGLSAADYGYADGGGVRGYALGGSPYHGEDPDLGPMIDAPPSPPREEITFRPELVRWLGNEPPPAGRFTGAPEPGVDPGAGMTFRDRAYPTIAAIEQGDFDPQGANSTTFVGTPGMEQANAGVVPMPQPRPEAAGSPAGAPPDDDDEVPATGLAAAGRGPSAPVVAFSPDGSDAYRKMPDAVRRPSGEEPGFGLGLLSRNAQTGLLAAGLGMMASRSPFLGNVVGEGGLAGLSAYGAANEADRRAALEADKLSREAQKLSFDQGMSTRRQNEVERHNRATEAKDRSGADKLSPNLRLNAKGEAELIPGVEDALKKLTAARRPAAGEPMDNETAEFLADRVLAGDTKALIGLGRGAQGAENLAKIQGIVARKAREGQPVSEAARNILTNAASFEGLKTAERTQAAIMAKLSVYGRTAFNATDIAEKLSEEVPRTNFQPINKVFNAARTNTGDPKIVALGQALMTLTNEYARAIGGGHGTVHDKEEAEKRLSMAQSHDQLKAVINVMRQEILAEERAMPAARQHVRDIYNPPPGGTVHTIGGEHGSSPTGTGVPPTAQREVGKVYDTPKGKLRWNGTKWETP